MDILLDGVGIIKMKTIVKMIAISEKGYNDDKYEDEYLFFYNTAERNLRHNNASKLEIKSLVKGILSNLDCKCNY